MKHSLMIADENKHEEEAEHKKVASNESIKFDKITKILKSWL